MRRCSVFQGVKQKSEFRPRLFVAESQQGKYLPLQLPRVNSYRPAAQFDAVKNQIICFSANIAGARLQRLKILIVWTGEWMVHWVVASIFFVILEHRKIGHPEKVEPLRIRESFGGGDLVPEIPQRSRNDRRFTGCYQYRVSSARAQFGRKRFYLFVSEPLGQRRAYFAGFGGLDPCQPSSAKSLHELGQLVQPFSRVSSSAAYRDRLDLSACIESGAIRREIGVGERARNILELHSEPRVRLVDAVAAHRLRVCQLRKRHLDFDADHT